MTQHKKKKTDGKAIYYPWTDTAKGLDGREATIKTIIRDKLLKLGYPQINKRPDEIVINAVKALLRILMKESRWLLVVSNDSSYLDMLGQITPQAYSLTAERRNSVHPASADLLGDLFKLRDYDDEDILLPLGRHAFENTGLVWFSNPIEADRTLIQWRGKSTRLFKQWAEPWISLVMTQVSKAPWDAKAHTYFVDRIGYFYGTVAQSYVQERMYDPVILTIPDRDYKYTPRRIRVTD